MTIGEWEISAVTGEFAEEALEDRYRRSRRPAEIEQIRLIWLLALLFFCLYGAVDFFMLARGGELFLLRLLILLAGGLAVIVSIRISHHSAADLVLFLSLALVSVSYIILLRERDIASNQQGAILLLLVGIYMFSPGRFWLVCGNGLICTLVFWFSAWHDKEVTGWISYSYLIPANLLASLVLSRTNRLQRMVYEQQQQLTAEIHRRVEFEVALKSAHKRNRALLYNALPRTIARELQKYPGTLPAQYSASTTVLFADIVGFSQLSRQMKASELVALLNILFSRFDGETRDHGLEKIKTIGDAYMAVSGVPKDHPDQCLRAARLAISMQLACAEVAQSLNRRLEIRIGIHCGPLVAGVVGQHRYAFDVWGETVNIASRIQACAEPGQILVSQQFRHALPNQVSFSEEKSFRLKGCGELFLSRLDSLGTISNPPGNVSSTGVSR